jgi:hypothetical protein
MRLLFASIHSDLDPSRGTALTRRELLEPLAGRWRELAAHLICKVWEPCGGGPPLSLQLPRGDTRCGPEIIAREELLAYVITRGDIAPRSSGKENHLKM